jgi:putative endonuclease
MRCTRKRYFTVAGHIARAPARLGPEGRKLAAWYLYLIECEDGSLYAGITTDVDRRFAEHLRGQGARYTRAHRPARLVGFKACASRSSALKAELAIKKLPASKKIAALLGPEALTA